MERPADSELPERIKSYKQVAGKKIPKELHPLLPTSFDIIGNIAVIKIPDELNIYRAEIAQAILTAYKSIKTVLHDDGVAGEHRARQVSLLAGEDKTRTVHKEYGIALEVDVATTYFSPRLANERWRVAQLCRPGETVIDAFAGVGPFSILIAKRTKAGAVHAIDINPAAADMLGANIRLNKVAGKVKAYCGDAAKVLPEMGKTVKADRIIMNLPWNAHEYLGAALQCAKPGSAVHYYEINEKSAVGQRAGEIVRSAGASGLKVAVAGSRIIRSYSPSQVNFVLDLAVQ